MTKPDPHQLVLSYGPRRLDIPTWAREALLGRMFNFAALRGLGFGPIDTVRAVAGERQHGHDGAIFLAIARPHRLRGPTESDRRARLHLARVLMPMGETYRHLFGGPAEVRETVSEPWLNVSSYEAACGAATLGGGLRVVIAPHDKATTLDVPALGRAFAAIPNACRNCQKVLDGILATATP